MIETFDSPVPPAADLGSCRLGDESAATKWRTWTDRSSVSLGRAESIGGGLVASVAPGEWMELGLGDAPAEGVDITHVRAMVRLTGVGARGVLEHVCALDLGESMTPDLAAARTLVAGVATELIRHDIGGEPSYLLLMSRSFARHVWDRIMAAASAATD